MKIDKQVLQNFILDFHENIKKPLYDNGYEGNKYNVFDILNINSQELRHSDFLAFLMNPERSGNLGEQFIRQLLVSLSQSYFNETLDFFDLFFAVFKKITVRREYKNIDIVCEIELTEKNFVIVIENKIYAGEQFYFGKSEKSQLEKYKKTALTEYKNYTPIFLFLSPDKRPASDKDWIAIDYNFIYEILCKINLANVDNTLKTLVTDYKKLIRRQFEMEADKELRDIALKIYNANKDIFDFIFENRPNRINTTAEKIRDFLNNSEFIHFDKEKSKRQNANILFTTKDLYTLCDHIYFQINVNEMTMWVYIENGTEKERRIFDMKATAQFKNLTKTFYLFGDKGKNINGVKKFDDLLLKNNQEELYAELEEILKKTFAPDGWVAEQSKRFCELLKK